MDRSRNNSNGGGGGRTEETSRLVSKNQATVVNSVPGNPATVMDRNFDSNIRRSITSATCVHTSAAAASRPSLDQPHQQLIAALSNAATAAAVAAAALPTSSTALAASMPEFYGRQRAYANRRSKTLMNDEHEHYLADEPSRQGKARPRTTTENTRLSTDESGALMPPPFVTQPSSQSIVMGAPANDTSIPLYEYDTQTPGSLSVGRQQVDSHHPVEQHTSCSCCCFRFGRKKPDYGFVNKDKIERDANAMCVGDIIVLLLVALLYTVLTALAFGRKQ